MVSEKSLNAKNLAALGADRLAELLLELVAGDAVAKRRLRLELASQSGGATVATEVRKRLATISKSWSFVDWQKIHFFAKDLEVQRDAIVTHVMLEQPGEAFDLLWRLLELAPSIYERCDDSNGILSEVMEEALENLEVAAGSASLPPEKLADRVFAGVCANDYGQFDRLIARMAGPLGEQGLKLLKKKFEDLALEPPTRDEGGERRVVALSSRGSIYEDEFEINRHSRLVQSSLKQIADALGDVDGYAARYSLEEQCNPAIAAGLARRFLAAGRTDDAMDALSKAESMRRQGGYWPDWDRMRIEVLDALGLTSEAQKTRWAIFESELNPDYLRAYLTRLPDFGDEEAELRALAYVRSFPDFSRALEFLVEWPAQECASKTIIERHDQLDGYQYWLLAEVADALELRYPLAATLALRAMIDFALERARYKRYPHAARHLRSCEHLSHKIADYGDHPDHASYLAGLKARHARKSGFWNA